MKHTKVNLAKDWIAYQKIEDKESLEAKKYEWAVFRFWKIILLSPDACWETILEIINQTDDEFILANLAAGPIESLLAQHSNVVIKWIEEEVNKNQKLKNLLSDIWKNSIPDEEWKRIQVLLS